MSIPEQRRFLGLIFPSLRPTSRFEQSCFISYFVHVKMQSTQYGKVYIKISGSRFSVIFVVRCCLFRLTIDEVLRVKIGLRKLSHS